MIRAEVRFKNSEFIKALERNGYKSIAEFSRVSEVNYQYLIEYANLKHIFKCLKTKVKIATLLNSDLHTLFDKYEEVVENNKGNGNKVVAEIPISKIISLSSDSLKQLESDVSTDDEIENQSLKMEINNVLDTLKDREKTVLNHFFGLNGYKELNLDEIAEMFGITRERIRQVKEKAIRRLRHWTRSEKIANGWYERPIKEEE